MLELRSISTGYGDNTVLEELTATLHEGKLTSIVGANGCGKSTLLRATLGMLPLSHGELTIDGNALSSLSRTEIARRIAYLPQGKSTPEMTVEQMVLHGRFPYLSYPRRYREQDREIAKRAMCDVGISHLAHKTLHTLSGGMRQTAYLAMALAQDTDYILLDEPTTYLDIAHGLTLMKLLRRLTAEGKGIVAVMHDLPLAFDFSDEIIVISKGKVVCQAEPTEVCSSSVIREIFGVDMGRREENKFYYQYQ